ncbi:hypothetical protein [Tunicatimonas pelagia]|uniref:hypothetical protein n=1 Tax=Tunicatimonas pelagia TaxID=931531 RepID=UPI0026651B9B|nr:hypothetical protein [Tunicatimonas pelagia]WKN40906.1 hypothetical protein P0M28_17875 [Tunicatimonas pelagia]
MTIKTHKLWLKISSVAIIAYALLFFLGSLDALHRPIEVVLDLSAWPFDGLQNYDAQTTVFLSAILGGVLFGWAMLIWLLSDIYEKEPETIRKAVLFSLFAWFVVDSVGCILSGDSSNAITNIALLLILVGPLWTKPKEKIKIR